MRRFRAGTLAPALGILLFAPAAYSHQLDSASLSLTEVQQGRFLVRWQASSYTLEKQLVTPAVFPAACRLRQPYLECGRSGLSGAIEFPWLAGSEASVMVDIDWLTGMRLLRVATASSPGVVVYGIPAGAGLRFMKPILVDYTRLGIKHILTGFDHLLFVLALTLLLGIGRPLVGAITAFTLAHSLTLACAVLGVLRLPSPPVEAAIALSIVLVCGECLRPGDSLARRAPWVVTFAFGLVHGLGFASSLLEVGLPEKHVPAALFCFNLGVELGQLGIIAAAGGVYWVAFRLRLRLRQVALRRGLVYAMGVTAAYWSFERALVVLAG